MTSRLGTGNLRTFSYGVLEKMGEGWGAYSTVYTRMIPKSVTEPCRRVLIAGEAVGGWGRGVQYQTILIRRDGAPYKHRLFPGI